MVFGLNPHKGIDADDCFVAPAPYLNTTDVLKIVIRKAFSGQLSTFAFPVAYQPVNTIGYSETTYRTSR
jgi:hypothetical protein